MQSEPGAGTSHHIRSVSSPPDFSKSKVKTEIYVFSATIFFTGVQ
jgi:hypothetical protein